METRRYFRGCETCTAFAGETRCDEMLWVIVIAVALLALIFAICARRNICIRRKDCCGKGCGCLFPVKRTDR